MNIIPKKSLGQNFLINEGVLDRIIESAELTSNDTVLEVGPGTGNLTRKLVGHAMQVIAIEKDHRLIEPLEKEFSEHKNVRVIEGDVLDIDPKTLSLIAGEYKIVANIPYYITSHFLRTIFEHWPQPKLIVLTIQKEVAQRIIAHPPDMSLLALSVQLYAVPKTVMSVSRGSFRPIPNVDSAVICLTPHALYSNAQEIMKIAKIGFAGKRKQLLPAFAKAFDLKREDLKALFEELGIPETARAETVSVEQWARLAGRLLST